MKKREAKTYKTPKLITRQTEVITETKPKVCTICGEEKQLGYLQKVCGPCTDYTLSISIRQRESDAPVVVKSRDYDLVEIDLNYAAIDRAKEKEREDYGKARTARKETANLSRQ